MIQFRCSQCQSRLSAPDDKAGTHSTCPKCGGTIDVPSPTSTPIHGTPAKGSLTIVPEGDVMIVSFQEAQILDTLTIDSLGNELYALVDVQAATKILLDFSKVQFISSQMLGVLITLHKKLTGIKGRMVIVAANAELQKVFHLMHLERFLQMTPDKPAALQILNHP